MEPNGTATCTSRATAANECGAGIAARGAKLAFTLQYATGTSITTNTMNAEKSSWAQAGINITLTSASFNTVIGNAIPVPQGLQLGAENWGGGWTFAPDYYPRARRSSRPVPGPTRGTTPMPTNDANIQATNVTKAQLTTYENYLAKQLPVICQPNDANPSSRYNKNLDGASRR